MKIIILCIIVICFNFGTSDAACMCRRFGTPQQQFCEAELAAILKINAGYIHKTNLTGPAHDSAIYEFTIERVLRATPSGTKALASNFLKSEGSCGITSLPEGKELIFTAYLEADGIAHFHYCYYHDLLTELNPEIKAGFLGGYKCAN
jgi:hypothetical protein